MEYFSIKALHLIFMVTWFAGLFYIVRLFIYHRASFDRDINERKVLSEQFAIMEKRLWYAITWPSAVLCTAFGITMLVMNPGILQQPFMHLKLAFVLGLWGYQLYTHSVFKKFQGNTSPLSDMALRFLNEVPTVLLVAIIFIIIKRDTLSWISGLVGIVGTAVLLSIAIKGYQRFRNK
jgi:putative membrane protein